MQDSAFHFKKQSRHLSRALWMKNAKLLWMMDDLVHEAKLYKTTWQYKHFWED
ncbi:hypothetical protein ACSBR1_020356 [Camellia fascicularis]